jgi:hypothetical protein
MLVDEGWVKAYTNKYDHLMVNTGISDGLPLIIALDAWRSELGNRWGHADLFLFWAESALDPNVAVSKTFWNSIPQLMAKYPDGYYTGYKVIMQFGRFCLICSIDIFLIAISLLIQKLSISFHWGCPTSFFEILTDLEFFSWLKLSFLFSLIIS